MSRARGTDLRSRGLSPRQLGTSPRAIAERAGHRPPVKAERIAAQVAACRPCEATGWVEVGPRTVDRCEPCGGSGVNRRGRPTVTVLALEHWPSTRPPKPAHVERVELLERSAAGDMGATMSALASSELVVSYVVTEAGELVPAGELEADDAGEPP